MANSHKVNEELRGELRRRKNEAGGLVAMTAQLSHLLLRSPAIIYSREPKGNRALTFISESVREKLGYEPWEFLDEPKFWLERIHPEDKMRVLTEFSFLFGKGYYICEYRFRDKEGRYRLIHDELKLICNTEGEPVEIVGCMLDVTKLREDGNGQKVARPD